MDINIEAGSVTSLIAPILRPLALGPESLRVGVILTGVVISTLLYLPDLTSSSRLDAYTGYRVDLGRGILLGLEILIGADIIAAIIAPPTWESFGLLGFVVLIRTFLSFSLGAEIDGQWPWSRQARRDAKTSCGGNQLGPRWRSSAEERRIISCALTATCLEKCRDRR